MNTQHHEIGLPASLVSIDLKKKKKAKGVALKEFQKCLI